jgi:hypothetical protein
MSDTASTDIKWLSDEEAQAIADTPSIAEWVAATCGALTKQEEQQGLELARRLAKQVETGQLLPNGDLLSAQDRTLL